MTAVSINIIHVCGNRSTGIAFIASPCGLQETYTKRLINDICRNVRITCGCNARRDGLAIATTGFFRYESDNNRGSSCSTVPVINSILRAPFISAFFLASAIADSDESIAITRLT
ncbi:hypothetical protein DERP_008207 [Dermatophagoides pteronyssinus]|uniref:Uncharacterized protein n=1 Tax=Dermatophagoides pteronyssinus TaxID=6956 RepID=A0ABQ8JKK9_DERPT|nr:hypothetical protein DERP_008207 [Dermatophagoides pteronyssinus]